MPRLVIQWDGALLGRYERDITESDAEFVKSILEDPPEQADPLTAAKARQAAREQATAESELELRLAWGDR